MNPLLKSRLPLMKKVALWIGGFLLFWGVLGAFVIPYFAPGLIGDLLSEKLHRAVTIEHIDINPYAMTVRVKGFKMMEPDKSGVAAAFDQVFVNLQAESLFRLAPVVWEARLTGPRLNIISNADGSYNFTDLIKEFLEKPDDGSKPKFAVFNIRLQQGRIDFDDRVAGQKHSISGIDIGIPFISNLPSKIDTFVQPALAANVDGAAFALKGKTRPFRATREATLDIKLHELDLARYFGYLPVPTRFTLDSGKLDTSLVVSFTQPENQVPAVTLAGDVKLRDVQATQEGGQPLLKLPELGIKIASLDALNAKAVLDSIVIQSPELTVHRNKDGSLNLAQLVDTPAARHEEKTESPPPQKPAFRLDIAEIRLAGGTVNFSDEVPATPFNIQLRELEATVGKFSLDAGSVATYSLAFTTDAGAALDLSGDLQLAPLRGKGQVKLGKLRVTDFASYYKDALPVALEDGTLEVAARYDVAMEDETLTLSIDDLAAGVSKPRLRQNGSQAFALAADTLALKGAKLSFSGKGENWKGEAENLSASLVKLALNRAGAKGFALDIGEFGAGAGKMAFSQDAGGQQMIAGGISSNLKKFSLKQAGAPQPIFALDNLAASGGEMDLAKKTLALKELKTSSGKLALARTADDNLNLIQLLRDASPAEAGKDAPAGKPETPWKFRLDKLALDGYSVRVDDHAVPDSLPMVFDPISLTARNISNAKGAKAEFNLKTGVGQQGHLETAGTLALEPLQANLRLDARQLGLVAVQTYFMSRFNALITSGAGSVQGDLAFEQSGDAERPFKAKFQGNLGVTDFSLLDKNNSREAAKWKTLAMENIQVGVNTGEVPYDVAIGGISLNDFYARIILNEDGRLALRKLVKGQARDGSTLPEGEEPPPAEAKPDSKQEDAGKAAEPAATAQAQPSPFRFRLDKLTLQGGDINFSDFFIKPNYSADLSEFGGSISGLSSDPGSTADVDLRGKVTGTAPLEIAGKVNPLAKDVFIDLKASAKGIELSNLSSYSGRYAGYAIDKGKLSVDIHYFIKERKLQAENHLFLDQLTFGQKVDSPDATKLPVTLAVALLKNSKGEIDINLPVQGSLDDPQFSVGGIVWKLIGNLIVKIVTSPFALLGSLFGGGDQQLEYLEFDPGLATISKEGEGKLQTLSKALNDRPGLKLEVAGRVEPETDKEGLKQAGLQYRVKTQKLKDTVKKGEDSASVDTVTVSAEEWPVYLKQAYKAEKFPKPRNLIGLAKDLPPAEMEKLILTNITVSEEDLRRLANQRADATVTWLTKSGGIATERVFITPPKLNAEGIKDKGRPNRVDFSLK